MQHRPMKRWARRLWIAALLSGKYEVGYGKLRQVTPDRKVVYCPIGVFCQIMPRVKFQAKSLTVEEDRYAYKKGFEWDYAPTLGSYMPDTLASEVDISYHAQFELANYHDEGKTFREIATWVKANL